MNKMSNKIFLVMILSCVVFLNGCLGGGGGSSTNPVASSQQELAAVSDQSPIASAEALNNTIKANSASWSAAENSITQNFNMSSFVPSDLFGCTPETGSGNAPNRAPSYAAVQLPSSLNWQNASGGNFLTSIKNQGRFGTCVAFAAIGALEATEKIATGNCSITPDYSELDLFYNGKGNFSYGWYISAAMNHLKAKGVVKESDAPYSFAPSFKLLTIAPSYTKITGFYACTGKDAMKQAIMKAPIAGSMDIYQDFLYYSKGVYQHVSGARLGGHAIMITGWDDSQNCWIAKNSWGENWGDRGFFRVKYGQCQIDTYVAYGLQVAASNDPLNPPAPVDPPAAELLPPASITCELIAETEITIKWTAGSGAEGYAIYKNGKLLLKTKETTYKFTGLTPNTVYQMQISSYRSTIESAKTPVYYLKTKALPVPPASFNLIKSTQTELYIKWASVNDIDGYNLYKNGKLETKVTGATEYAFTGLTANTAYQIQISTFRGARESARTPYKLFRTLAPPPLPVPASIDVTFVSTCEIEVKWPACDGVEGYKVYRNGVLVAKTTETVHRSTKLNPSTNYTIQVSSFAGTRESLRTPYKIIKTAALPARPAITSLRLLPSGTAVNVTFNLYDADSAALTTSLLYSTDGGKTFNPCASATGDLGTVSTGSGKSLKWNIKDDFKSKGVIRYKLVVKDGYYTVETPAYYISVAL